MSPTDIATIVGCLLIVGGWVVLAWAWSNARR